MDEVTTPAAGPSRAAATRARARRGPCRQAAQCVVLQHVRGRRDHPVRDPGPGDHLPVAVDGQGLDRRRPDVDPDGAPGAGRSGRRPGCLLVWVRWDGSASSGRCYSPGRSARYPGERANVCRRHDPGRWSPPPCAGPGLDLLHDLADLTLDSWLDQPTLRIYDARAAGRPDGRRGRHHRRGRERPLRRPPLRAPARGRVQLPGRPHQRGRAPPPPRRGSPSCGRPGATPTPSPS